MANSLKFYLPTTVSANSWSSALGSEPGEMMKRIGSLQLDSFSYKFLKANGAGWIDWPPKASKTKCCIADSSLSGLKTLVIMHLWKELILWANYCGKLFSGSELCINGAQTDSLSNCNWLMRAGKEPAKLRKASALSFGTHLGAWACDSAPRADPEKNSHSFLPNRFG